MLSNDQSFMNADIQYLIEVYVQLFAASSPIAAMAMFIGVTADYTPQERWETSRMACHVSLGILLVCALFGSHLLDLVGITMDAFRIAGGIVMGIMGIALIKFESSSEEGASSSEKKHADITITPLAFPIIAGPGAISSLMIVKSEAANTTQSCYAYLGVLLIMATYYIFSYFTSLSSKWLHPTFLKISSKLCGLVVLAMAAQFLAIGLCGFMK